MPTLANAKHERFAQLLASGEPADRAYVTVGYKKNDGNSTRLKGNDTISARVREILDAACQNVVIERSWVLKELHRIAQADFGSAHVSVGEKRRALVDIARMEGWIIDKTELSGGLTISHEQALAMLK